MNYYRFRVASYPGAARNISSSFNFVSRRSIDQRLSCRLRLRRRLDISLTKQDFPPICERGRFTSGPVPRARKMAAWKSAKLRNPPKLSLFLDAIFIVPASRGRRSRAITRLLASEVLRVFNYFRQVSFLSSSQSIAVLKGTEGKKFLWLLARG